MVTIDYPHFTDSYADALNFHIGGPVDGYPSYIHDWYDNRRERLTRKFNKLKAYCDKIGRTYEDIERTVLATIKIAPEAMSITEVVDLCKELADLGVQHVIFNMPNVHEIKSIEIIGKEIIQQVSKM